MKKRQKNEPKKAEDKKEKPAKGGNGSGKAQAIAVLGNKKVRIIAIAAVALVLILCLVIGSVSGVKSCKRSDNLFSHFNSLTVTSAESLHQNKTQVGCTAEITGTVERYKPVSDLHHEGLSSPVTAFPKGFTSIRVRSVCTAATSRTTNRQ